MTALLAVLLLAGSFASAQDATNQDEGYSIHGGGRYQDAGGLHQDSQGAPPPNPVPQGGGGACSERPAAGGFRVANANGWWPVVSPDGRYAAYGTGQIFVVDVKTHKERTVSKNGCWSANWIRPGVLTYVCPITNDTAERWEATAPLFAAKKVTADPALAAGNEFKAADGHWISFLASKAMRVAFDNKLVGNNLSGCVDTSRGMGISASDNSHAALRLYRGGRAVRDYRVKVPMFEASITRGYIVYGGHGPVHGIGPDGRDIDLTATPFRYEGSGKVFWVANGKTPGPWVGTTSWDFAHNTGYVLLRPWGKTEGIILEAAAVALSAVEHCGAITAAYNDDKGRMSVVTVPVDAPRRTLMSPAASGS